jgi:hypothetical protein
MVPALVPRAGPACASNSPENWRSPDVSDTVHFLQNQLSGRQHGPTCCVSLRRVGMTVTGSCPGGEPRRDPAPCSNEGRPRPNRSGSRPAGPGTGGAPGAAKGRGRESNRRPTDTNGSAVCPRRPLLSAHRSEQPRPAGEIRLHVGETALSVLVSSDAVVHPVWHTRVTRPDALSSRRRPLLPSPDRPSRGAHNAAVSGRGERIRVSGPLQPAVSRLGIESAYVGTRKSHDEPTWDAYRCPTSYRPLHGGVGNLDFPVATSSGHTNTGLPSCH